MSGDNSLVDVIGDGKVCFEDAVKLTVSDGKYKPTAKFWGVTSKGALVMFWCAPLQRRELLVSYGPFPFDLSIDAMIPFCWDWLQAQSDNYDEEPDHDGDSKKGFWITTACHRAFVDMSSNGGCWAHINSETVYAAETGKSRKCPELVGCNVFVTDAVSANNILWRQPAGFDAAIFAVKPHWTTYGK